MRTRTACLLVAAALVGGSACRPPVAPDVQWSRTFASVDTSANWIQQTKDGGFVVAGSVLPNRKEVPWDVDMYLLKLDSRGNTVWQDTYSSGETHDYALSVQQTSDGGFVLAGMGGDSGSVIVLKTDSTGTREWDFTGFPDATIYDIQQTADGGYITAGLWSTSDSLYLLKLDSQGRVTWRRSYDEFYGHWWATIPVQQTTDGGFIVAAEALLKTDGDGNQQWKYRYPGVLVMFSVQQTSDGGFIAAGLAREPWPLGRLRRFTMVLLKTDSAGTLSWRRMFASGQESGGNCARQTLDGGYIICGYMTSGDTSRATIIKTDQRGNPLWKKTLPGPTSIDNAQQTSDGGYILCEGSRHIWKLAPERKR
jgi:hypothetical protein